MLFLEKLFSDGRNISVTEREYPEVARSGSGHIPELSERNPMYSDRFRMEPLREELHGTMSTNCSCLGNKNFGSLKNFNEFLVF